MVCVLRRDILWFYVLRWVIDRGIPPVQQTQVRGLAILTKVHDNRRDGWKSTVGRFVTAFLCDLPVLIFVVTCLAIDIVARPFVLVL